jgi:hypothetical protein
MNFQSLDGGCVLQFTDRNGGLQQFYRIPKPCSSARSHTLRPEDRSHFECVTGFLASHCIESFVGGRVFTNYYANTNQPYEAIDVLAIAQSEDLYMRAHYYLKSLSNDLGQKTLKIGPMEDTKDIRTMKGRKFYPELDIYRGPLPYLPDPKPHSTHSRLVPKRTFSEWAIEEVKLAPIDLVIVPEEWLKQHTEDSKPADFFTVKPYVPPFEEVTYVCGSWDLQADQGGIQTL